MHLVQRITKKSQSKCTKHARNIFAFSILDEQVCQANFFTGGPWARCIGDSEDVETLAEDEIAKLMDHRVETSRKTNNVKFMSLISQEDQEEATRACQDKRRKKKGVKTKTKK